MRIRTANIPYSDATSSVTWTMSDVKPPASEVLQAVLPLLRRRFSGWAIDAARCWCGHATWVTAWRTSTQHVYAKTHARDRKYLQEKQAYLQWSSRVVTPRLLDYCNRSRTLLLSEAPGRSGAVQSLSLDAHYAAGRWLRQLHDIDVPDPDMMSWLDAIDQRIEAPCRRRRKLCGHRTSAGPGDRADSAFTPDPQGALPPRFRSAQLGIRRKPTQRARLRARAARCRCMGFHPTRKCGVAHGPVRARSVRCWIWSGRRRILALGFSADSPGWPEHVRLGRGSQRPGIHRAGKRGPEVT